MRQAAGVVEAVHVQATAPVDNETDGTPFGFLGQSKVYKYAFFLTLVGNGSVDPAIWVRREEDKRWFEVVDGNNIGALPTGLTSPAREVYVVTNVGIFDQIMVVTSNNVGGITVSAEIQEIIENNYQRGD